MRARFRSPRAGLAGGMGFLLLLAALLAGGVPEAARTQGEAGPIEEDVARWALRLSEIEARLGTRDPEIGELDAFRDRLDAIGDALKSRIAAREAELAPLEAGLARLGPAPGDDAPESPRVAEERARLGDRIAALSDGLGLARNLQLSVEEALARVVAMRRAMFRDRILTRHRGVFEPGLLVRAVEGLGRKFARLEAEIRADSAGLTPTGKVLRALGALAVIGLLVLIFRAMRRVTDWLKSRSRPDGEGGEEEGRNAALSIGLTLARLTLPMAAIGLCALWLSRTFLDGPLGLEILNGLAWSAVLVAGAYGLGGAFFAPDEPALRISRLTDREARAMHRWLMALALTVGADRLLVARGVESLGLPFETLAALNTSLMIPGGIALWVLARALAPAEAQAGKSDEDEDENEDEEGTAQTAPALAGSVVRLCGIAVRVVAVAAPILAFLGFFAASRYVFHSVVFSGSVLGVGVVLFHAVNEAVARVAAETGPERRRGLRFIPVIVAFFLICVAVPSLLLIWGATPGDLETWWDAVAEGVRIGEIVLSPLDLVTFFIVFSIGYVVTRMIQGALSGKVLPLTGLDTGAREAVTAGIGYVGIVVAALIAISATGLDLSNVAIVAGALSVGIGFGLQNIVNNFVSGIILLIERPIKAGDWVELASGMGTVKKVNVRSTEVETFDRATLFVPNSELISSSVVNWTHSNMRGRLIVKVGVAYGSDPRKVEEILLEIAGNHPKLFGLKSKYPPYVLFRGFGDNSLDFEIRGVLRDVNWILNVQSDLYFAITESFEKAGIEIPFAQRDLHIRNLHELGRGIADAARSDRTGAGGGR